jgi:YgiT-type zinc finger domain-containing protein
MCDYGECDICGARMEERRVKQELWIKGKLLVVENVPAGVCPRCGAREVNADVGHRILDIISHHKARQKVRTIAVPVFRFSKAGA